MDYDYMNKVVRKHMAALTRSKKKGPQAIIDACDAAFDAFNSEGMLWPDNWHLWQRSKDDAYMELLREGR